MDLDKKSPKRYERLGFDDRFVTNLDGYIESIAKNRSNATTTPGRISDAARAIPYEYEALLKGLWLGERPSDAATFAPEFIFSVYEYCLGQWQTQISLRRSQPPNVDEWRASILWDVQIRHAFMWGAATQGWESLRKISAFLTPDIRPDPSENDRSLYIAIGQYLRDEPVGGISQQLESVAAGRRKGPRLMAEAMLAIIRREQATFDNVHLAVLKHWKSRDWRLDWGLCPEGSFLYHLARRDGLTCSVHPGYEDHIVVL